jgi:aspartate dehydrogenase
MQWSKQVLMVGYGAIGSTVFRMLADDPSITIGQILVPRELVEQVRLDVGGGVNVVSEVSQLDRRPDLALECAGHTALLSHVMPLLESGIDCIVVSVGALSDSDLLTRLMDAARLGRARLKLLSGAIGGLDALSAASEGGLEEVLYIGRKPVAGWSGTPADEAGLLNAIETERTIFEGSAREAARLYPKNANVAASVALAGVGMDRTRTQLIADATTRYNTHRIIARGAFGELTVQLTGNPLSDNPKTSALAAFSALRALHDEAAPFVI